MQGSRTKQTLHTPVVQDKVLRFLDGPLHVCTSPLTRLGLGPAGGDKQRDFGDGEVCASSGSSIMTRYRHVLFLDVLFRRIEGPPSKYIWNLISNDVNHEFVKQNNDKSSTITAWGTPIAFLKNIASPIS